MLKITKTNGTKLSNKIATLKKVDEKGFYLVDDDGDDYITFDLIKELFLDKEVKIIFEEINRTIEEV